MRKLTFQATFLAAALLGAAFAVPASGAERQVDGDPAAKSPRFVPGEAIVRFEGGTGPSERLAVRRAADVALERTLELAQAQVVRVDGSVQAAVDRLERHPNVAYAQPNYRYSALAPAPDDTFFGDLWGLRDALAPDPGVDVLEAWDVSRGAGQVIAVLDTGVARDHPDVMDNFWTGGPGGSPGFDFVDNDADPDDYDFHGTHVAGTAAAIADNGLGIAGVAPQAEIMAVRVLDGDGSGSSSDIADGIAFAAQNGADVVNLSLGGPAGAGDTLMSNAVTLADTLDVVVVAAAGNEANDNDANATTPCTLQQANLLCVAAVTQSGALASFSNFGATTVDLGAPGSGVLSARTDYAPVFDEGFDAGIVGWSTSELNGAKPWSSVSSPNSDGTPSASDSSGDYANSTSVLDDFAEAGLTKTTGLDLSSQRGCRLHFDVRHDLEEDFDFLEAGAVTPAGLSSFDGRYFTGSTGGLFFAEEVSISDLDGEVSVSPWFALLSDESIVDDGAYIDDLDVRCRDNTYLDSRATAGSYVSFSGTSMATPHVAGVAALVGAAAPDLADTDIVEAILDGGFPLASLAGKTVSGRTADAGGAIAAALGLPDPPPPDPGANPDPEAAPGPTLSAPAPVAPSPPPFSTPTPPLAQGESLPPAKPNLRRSKSTVRVSRRRAFRYAFAATPGLTGEALFRTRRKAVVSRRAHLTIGRKRFVVGRVGKVVLELRLSRRKVRILRANGRLLLKVTVTVGDGAGRRATATKRLRLLPPRRR